MLLPPLLCGFVQMRYPGTETRLLKNPGSACVQYSFRSQLVFRCGARPAVNETHQTDFLFLETSCGLGRCLVPPCRNRFRRYELPHGSPFHPEPTHIRNGFLFPAHQPHVLRVPLVGRGVARVQTQSAFELSSAPRQSQSNQSFT